MKRRNTITMNTVPNVAKMLGIQYQTLKRLLRLRRIPGCRPVTEGQWHLLTREEILLIEQFVKR